METLQNCWQEVIGMFVGAIALLLWAQYTIRALRRFSPQLTAHLFKQHNRRIFWQFLYPSSLGRGTLYFVVGGLPQLLLFTETSVLSVLLAFVIALMTGVFRWSRFGNIHDQLSTIQWFLQEQSKKRKGILMEETLLGFLFRDSIEAHRDAAASDVFILSLISSVVLVATQSVWAGLVVINAVALVNIAYGTCLTVKGSFLSSRTSPEHLP